ncbi:N-acetyltransferase [Roseovarius sp. PS-C2]|uniref:GNAT family N-acetyltransferase n=1 Tax=Roseovarius sp. PS-C2 TaxID=2820814 RepID=UPI001C0C710E|nr:N-acetyltransferase [Roseovarius sp. PS-C2]MBU3259046.1 N-acetyltransferase [Roseovarius sp. PS-C2]
MTKTPGFTRDMRPGEEAGVEALLRLAFGGLDEARLVAALRKSGAMAGEMVLPCDGEIVGYYALSRFIRPKGWLCLAPVAIHPDWQGMRHGKRMIGQLTEWARLSGTYVVVLGQPAFYGKAGFSLDRAAGLTSPYPITQTLLAGPGQDVPEQALTYPKAFEGL